MSDQQSVSSEVQTTERATPPRQTDVPTPTTAEPLPRFSARLRMVAAVLITMLGALLYLIQINTEWIRRTGLPSLVIMTLGTVAGVRLAVRHRSAFGAFLASASVVLTGALAYYIYGARLPAPGSAPVVGATAPTFVLPDSNGRRISLEAFRGRGPVLLVFYRGFW